MVSDQETIKKTRLFGLNTYEAKIWTALLSRGVSTAGELSDIANVPIESLEKKGFVIMKLGKPINYIAIPPKDVLENVKKQIQQKTEKHLLKIKSDDFNNLINTFQDVYDKNTNITDNIIAVLKGRKNIYKHINFLSNNTNKNTFFLVEDETGNISITETTKQKSKTTLTRPNLKIRMYLDEDDNTVIFPLEEKEIHQDYDLGVWIKDKQTTNFLKQLSTSNL